MLNGTSMFIRKDFLLYDCGLLAILPPKLMLLYEILRRFVWRGYRRNKSVNALRDDGRIVSRVGTEKLSMLAGYAHRQSVTSGLNQLEQLGWIQRVRFNKTTNEIVDTAQGTVVGNLSTLYVLGNVAGGAEVFFADSDIRMLADTLLKSLPVSVVSPVTSKTPCNDEGAPTDDDPNEEPGYMYAPLSRADTRWRICQALRWFKLHKAEFYAQELEAKWSDKFLEYTKFRWTGAVPVNNDSSLKKLPTVDDIKAKVAALEEKYWALSKIVGPDVAHDLLTSGEAGAETVATLLAGAGGLVGLGEEQGENVPSAKSLDISNCNPAVSPNCNPAVSPNCNPAVSFDETGEILKRENSLIDNLEVENLEAGGTLSGAQLEDGSESKNIKEGEEKDAKLVVKENSAPEVSCVTTCAAGGPVPKWLQTHQQVVEKGLDRGVEPVRTSSRPVRTEENMEALQKVLDAATARSREAKQEQVTKAAIKERRMQALAGETPIPINMKKQLEQLETRWRSLMEERYPQVTIARWEGADRGKVRNLLGKYSGTIVVDALEYVVTRWDDISARILKKKGGVPSLGFLLRFHDILVIESQIWARYMHTKREVDAWDEQNPHKPYPPPELDQRYQQVRRELAEVGLTTD